MSSPTGQAGTGQEAAAGPTSQWYCVCCKKTCTGEVPYREHLSSRKHLHRVKIHDGQAVLKKEGLADGNKFDDGPRNTQAGVPRRLRKAETILAKRTARIALVLESCYDNHNHQAVLRTCESFGIQNVHIVEPVIRKANKHHASSKIARQALSWLTVTRYDTSEECVRALRDEGREIWVTDLSQHAVALEHLDEFTLPAKMALVIGRETDGASEVMLNAADKRVYLPIHGFCESLNLSVATALVIQTLFTICPEARGDMRDTEKAALRKLWYEQLARTPDQKETYPKFLENPPSPFDDLRRPETLRTSWVDKKIEKKQGVA